MESPVDWQPTSIPTEANPIPFKTLVRNTASPSSFPGQQASGADLQIRARALGGSIKWRVEFSGFFGLNWLICGETGWCGLSPALGRNDRT